MKSDPSRVQAFGKGGVVHSFLTVHFDGHPALHRRCGGKFHHLRGRYPRALFERRQVRRFAAIERTARIRLLMLDAAETLDDLRVPPGNRLEALKGDRAGQHCIRIDRQWRVRFVWTEKGAEHVEICDCH